MITTPHLSIPFYSTSLFYHSILSSITTINGFYWRIFLNVQPQCQCFTFLLCWKTIEKLRIGISGNFADMTMLLSYFDPSINSTGAISSYELPMAQRQPFEPRRSPLPTHIQLLWAEPGMPRRSDRRQAGTSCRFFSPPHIVLTRTSSLPNFFRVSSMIFCMMISSRKSPLTTTIFSSELPFSARTRFFDSLKRIVELKSKL